MQIRHLFISFLFLILVVPVFGQDPVQQPPRYLDNDSTVNSELEMVADVPADTVNIDSETNHSPGLASLYSAVLPGLGQAYNKSYWKIPIVYGTLFTFGYLIYDSNEKLQFVRRNLIAETDGDPETINYTGRSAENLSSNQERLRRARDLNMILLFIMYLLNVADAHIDAHLVEFDANPDINAYVDPKLITIPNQATGIGMSLTFNF